MLRNILKIWAISALLFSYSHVNAQVDPDQTGAWYMYFWNTQFGEGPWGLQGDVQYRNWNLIGDLEQLLLRGGLTYQPQNTKLKLTLGYGNITSGEFGDGTSTTGESRIYQEALLPQKVGKRLLLTHRFRYEQRFVKDRDTRTLWRYNIFINVPFNQDNLGKGAVYLAFYNELFINGNKTTVAGRTVQVFDRNRTYLALGYSLSPKIRMQFGIMKQTNDNYGKSQIQLSLHQSI